MSQLFGVPDEPEMFGVADEGELFGVADEDQEDEKVEYSTGRQALSTFFEGALGVGTEVDAFIRTLGSDMGYGEALAESQEKMAAFKEENPQLAATAEWGGVGASLFVPGGALMQAGKAATKAARYAQIGKGVGIGAASGAGYQYAAEDLETGERGYKTGAAIGAVTGGIGARYLLKSAEDLARHEDELRSVKGTHIWGDEGAPNAKVMAKDGDAGTAVTEIETSAKKRERGATGPVGTKSALAGDQSLLGKAEGVYDAGLLGTREWVAKHAGPRAARLVTIADVETKRMSGAVRELAEKHASGAYKFFASNDQAYHDFNNIGYDGRTVDAMVEKYPEAAGLVDMFREVQKNEFPAWGKLSKDLEDYFPRRGKGKMVPGQAASASDYHNPAYNVQRYAEEVMNARILADVFFKDKADEVIANLKPAYKGQGRMEAMLKAIEKEAIKQGGKGSEAASRNMVEGLRTTLINAKQGGDAVSSQLRKWSSAGLLSNWSNALLNAPEGAVQAVYQNGLGTMMKTMPSAMLASINSMARQTKGVGKNVIPVEWIDNAEMGLGAQYLGEAMAESASRAQRFGEEILSAAYTLSGVRTINEVNQEIAGNAAIKRGTALAKKAIETGSYRKLARHPAAKGMTQQELQQTARALANKDYKSPEVRQWYGVSMGLLQPAYSSSMPKFFNDVPGGRVLYGMASFMNRQHNIIRNDIYLNMKDVVKYGANSDEGRDALKESMVNSAKYITLMGYFNGFWDDMRKDVMDGVDRDDMEEYLTGDFDIRGYEMSDINDVAKFLNEGALNQLVSNVSSGIYDVRAEEYGRRPVGLLDVPAIGMAQDVGGAVYDSARYQDPYYVLKAAQTYVPGPSHVDKATRMLTGDRLSDFATDTGIDASGLLNTLMGTEDE